MQLGVLICFYETLKKQGFWLPFTRFLFGKCKWGRAAKKNFACQIKDSWKVKIIVVPLPDVLWKMHWCCLPCSSPLCKQNWRVCPKVSIIHPTPCTSLSILIFSTNSLKNWITQVWQADPVLWRGQALCNGLAWRPRCSLSHINSLCPSHLPPRYRKVKKLPFHSTNQFLCKACGSFPLLNFTPRFLYPEKCVVFLNLSYLLLAMGYIVRLSAGTIKQITWCSD